METFNDTKTTTWFNERVPISVYISWNNVEGPIFTCIFEPQYLLESSMGALEDLTSQIKALMRLLFADIETTIKINLDSILKKLNWHHNRPEQISLYDCDNERCTSTQFIQIQKKQLIELQEHLELYCNVTRPLGFNSSKYDLNLIKSFFPTILGNEQDIEATVIKKANQFISLRFDDLQLLHILNFQGGAKVFIRSWTHTKLQKK